jgi:hypothetical protein
MERAGYRGKLGLLGLAVAVEGGMLVVALMLGYLLDCPILAQTVLDWQHMAVALAATVPLVAGFLVLYAWPAGPLIEIKRFLDQMVRRVFGQCSLLELAAISALAGLGEEFLFRGLIQGLAIRWLGVVGGLLVASALFGLAHLISVTYALLAALLGLYFGLLLLATGNLLVPAIAHGLYDLIALVLIIRWFGRREPERGVSGGSEAAGQQWLAGDLDTSADADAD